MTTKALTNFAQGEITPAWPLCTLGCIFFQNYFENMSLPGWPWGW